MTTNEHVKNIESRLTQTFRRVTPSSTFVNTVRGRIHNGSQQMVMQKQSPRHHLLLALGGVLSASLLILTLARVLFYLVGRSKQSV